MSKRKPARTIKARSASKIRGICRALTHKAAGWGSRPQYQKRSYGACSTAVQEAQSRGYLSLKRGFPNNDGMRSCRNKSNCARTPTDRPASLFNGTIASAATCQLTATYREARSHRRYRLLPSRPNENSTRGTSGLSGSSFGSLPGVKRLVR